MSIETKTFEEPETNDDEATDLEEYMLLTTRAK
jgi:hypothetical protein